MKKVYFSTFLQGLEGPVETMLHKEGGVAVERVLPGAAIYRSVREPSFPYLHQTFQLLFQMKPFADVNEAVKRLITTGGWLDRFPYEDLQEGRRFRIITSVGDKLVSANMRYVSMLENAIAEQTGMRTGREKPDVELWILCRPEASYFLWRIGRHATTKQDGPIRSDVCAVLSFLSKCGGKNAAILGDCGAELPQAMKFGGVRSLTCVCRNARETQKLSGKLSGVRIAEGSVGYTDLPDSSQHAVIIPLPVKEKKTEVMESELRGAIFEARRILEEDGILLVVAALDQAESTLRKTRGIRMLGRCDFMMSGQKCAVWMIGLRTEEISEEE